MSDGQQVAILFCPDCLLPTAYCLFFPHRGFGVSPFALAAISFSL